MPYNLKKDLTHCLSRAKIFIGHGGRYYMAYLWDDRNSMHENATTDIDGEMGDGLCCHAPYLCMIQEDGMRRRFPRKLGEMHFLQGKWDMEVVAHECFHATNHTCKAFGVNPQEDIEQEEFAAYVQGELTNQAYKWLWDVDKK